MKIFFVINARAGSHGLDIKALINAYFEGKSTSYILYDMPKGCTAAVLKAEIDKHQPDRVVAVGGDGTLKLVAECLLHSPIAIGVLPAGSANGMAKELGLPNDIKQALEVVSHGRLQPIHVVQTNNEICVHLADLGFNAYLVKKFDAIPERGMWGYAIAMIHALWNHKRVKVELEVNGRKIKSAAAMVAIANATMYGTGLKINPNGRLDDHLFEVILVKDYSYLEILKIWLTKLPFNPKKIEVFQVTSVKINAKHRVHFQVDGEYLGKTYSVEAKILPAAITVIMP